MATRSNDEFRAEYELLLKEGKSVDRLKSQWRAAHPMDAAIYLSGPAPIPGEAEAAPAPQRSLIEGQMRGAGLAARALGPATAGALTGAAIGSVIPGVGTALGGAAGALAGTLAPPAADLYTYAKSKITGKQPQMYPSQGLQQAMTKIGLPEPQGPWEQGAVNVISQIPSIYAPQTIARGLISGPAPAVSPASATGRTLGLLAGPETQTTGAALREAALQGTQAVAGEVAARNVPEEWGPTAQLAAELATGVVGTAGPGATRETLRAIQDVFPGRTPQVASERARNIAVLETAGIPLTPAMTMGGTVPAAVETGLKNLPLSANIAARADAATQEGFTKAVMRMAGIEDGLATPDNLTKAQENFGNKFESTYGKLSGALDAKSDNNFLGNLYAEERALRADGEDALANRLSRYSKNLTSKMSGEIDPGQIQKELADIKTQGDKSLRSELSSERDFGQALLNIREHALIALENAAAKTGEEGLRDDIEALHRQYARFNSIKNAMKNAPQDALNTGYIPVQQIDREAKGYAGSRYMISNDPWVQLIRSARAIIPNTTKDSGTAARTYYQEMLTGKPIISGLLALGGAGGLGAATGVDVAKAVGATAAGSLLPAEIARRWYSPIPPQGMRPVVAARQPVAGILTPRQEEE
jgi:hypothetical protein